MTSSTGSVSIALCGSGGAGVMTAANMFIDAAAKAGYYALFNRSMGPQIRGGEAAAMVRLSSEPLSSVDDTYDIMVAIDWQNVQRFAAELPLDSKSVIITDPSAGEVPEAMSKSGARIVELPMKDLAKGIEGGRPNMIALGAVVALIGFPVDALTEVLGKSLKKKRADAYEASVAAVRKGAEAAAALVETKKLGKPPAAAKRWAVTGNQATGIGAVRGGVRFCAAYPITPATEVLDYLTSALNKVGGVFVQAEDELASINMCIGGSFAGLPAITSTAGPGLALMAEALGLAVCSETPVVVVDVARGGPSTGIPTKSEQSDLNIAVYGLHGDAPHIVVAPQSIGDCLFSTQWAVYLAEALQTAAIVLSDQSLGQSRTIIDEPAKVDMVAKRRVAETPAEGEKYKRYALTADGISPMAVPGTPGCQYTADGLEHTVTGVPSSQESDHAAQLDKRMNKLTGFDYGDQWATIEGSGKVAVVTWGSCTGAAREAMARCKAEGFDVKLIAPRLLYPTLPALMGKALEGVEKLLVVEQSHLGQFHRYLRGEYDLPGKVALLNRAGPLPIRPGEIHKSLLSLKA
jgi:2-oxoglutarate ferredoxin oxidoreductase subunit alpha